MSNRIPQKIAKTIVLKVEGDSLEDYQRALSTAIEELQQSATGGAGGNNSSAYEISVKDTPKAERITPV